MKKKNILFIMLLLVMTFVFTGCDIFNKSSTSTSDVTNTDKTNPSETEIMGDAHYVIFYEKEDDILAEKVYATWNPTTTFNVSKPSGTTDLMFSAWYIYNEIQSKDLFDPNSYYQKHLAEDLIVVGQWEYKIYGVVSYTANYYFQNIYDDGYTKDESRSGVTTTLMSQELVALKGPNIEGFIFNQERTNCYMSTIERKDVVDLYYDRLTYTVTFNGNDGILISGSTTQTIRYQGYANPPVFEKQGYTLNGWDANYTYITKTITINAIYKLIPVYYNYTLDNYEGGSITGKSEGSYLVDTTISLNAVADENYQFDGWYINDELVSKDLNYSFFLKSDTTVRPKFIKITKGNYIIQPTAANHNVWDDANINYSGIYFFKKGINTRLDHESGITTAGNNLASWIRIAIDQVNNTYQVVAVMQTGDTNFTTTFNNALYKVMIWSDANLDDSIIETFKAIQVGQTVTFNGFNNDGTFEDGATIMISSEVIDATNITIDGDTSGYTNTKIKLNATLTPTNSNEQIIWSSSDTTIATVDNTGNVTLIKAGSVKITATTSKVSVEHIITITIDSTYSNYKDISSNIASGYLYRNYNTLTTEFFNTMDIIFCSFVLVDVDGNFTGLDGLGSSISASNTKSLNNMKTYVIKQAHDKGVRVIVSLGGGEKGQDLAYEAIAKNATLRTNLINNTIKLINEYGFDGVDIDWEYPDATNDPNFTLLMKELYTAVKKNNPNHLVTAAIGAGKWQPPHYDLSNSIQYMDYINMMAYNMCSSDGYYQNALYASTTFNNTEAGVGKTLSSCSIDETIKLYNGYGIPNNKIIIGFAFYGILQTRASTNSNWTRNSNIYYTNLKSNYINNSNYTYHYDTKANVPYLLSQDKLNFISYDDPSSVLAKCNYIKTKGLAGIMYWENGCDSTNDLVNAIYDGLKK